MPLVAEPITGVTQGTWLIASSPASGDQSESGLTTKSNRPKGQLRRLGLIPVLPQETSAERSLALFRVRRDA